MRILHSDNIVMVLESIYFIFAMHNRIIPLENKRLRLYRKGETHFGKRPKRTSAKTIPNNCENINPNKYYFGNWQVREGVRERAKARETENGDALSSSI